MLRRLSLAFLASLSFLSMGASSCGGGGGPQCPPRAGEAAADDPPGSQDEAVDAGPSSQPGDPANAATNTGPGGGGPSDCPRE